MESSTEGLVGQLVEIVGSDWVKTDDVELQHYGKDWTNVFHSDPIAIVRSGSGPRTHRFKGWGSRGAT